MKFIRNYGFSVTELSVSLLVIGFIAGMIISGNNIYNQSKLRTIIKEIQIINNALITFKDRYGYPPGDLPSPPSNWLTSNGNGDYKISLPNESSFAWYHLYMSGLINQTFPVQYSTINSVVVYNAYVSNYKPVIYDVRSYSIFYYNPIYSIGLGLTNTSYTNAAIASYAALKTSDAYYIDSKIDDGIANYGILLAADGDDVSVSSCSGSVNNTTTNVINYNFSNNLVACRLSYIGSPIYQ